MKISVRYARVTVTAHASAEVSRYLYAAKRKEENLRHEKRRHWAKEPFNESSTALHPLNQYQLTPEEQFYQKEALKFIMETLATCTPVQRERFLLFALDGMSFAEIAKLHGCSKYAVRDSIEAVRKKFQTIFKNSPHDLPFSGL